jgi:hypothetical protein
MAGLKQSAQTSDCVDAFGVEIKDRGLLNSIGNF